MYVCMYVCMYVLYVCMCCMYVCMYVCMCIAQHNIIITIQMVSLSKVADESLIED